MRAVWLDAAGDAGDVLTTGEREMPEPAAGEVRVRVAYSAVNPTDVKRRQSGRELHLFSPIVPGNDGAGVIDAVGEGVDGGRIGERVWVFGAQAGRAHGTHAEYSVVPDRLAIALPDGVSFTEGACLGVPAVTAWCGLLMDGPIDGQWVLVSGAGGRVGQYGVQLAKRAGARVIATAGRETTLDRARALGADAVIDYRSEDVAERILAESQGGEVTRALEVAFGANIPILTRVMAMNGCVASYASDAEPEPVLPFYDFMFNNVTVRPFSIYGLPAATLESAFEDLTRALAAGALVHPPRRILPLGEAAAAHQVIEAGEADGVVLLEVAGESVS